MSPRVERCQFCGEPFKQVRAVSALGEEEIISFECGTLSNDPSPRTVLCWTGWVMSLKDRLGKFENLLVAARKIKEAMLASLMSDSGYQLQNIISTRDGLQFFAALAALEDQPCSPV